MTDQTSNPGAAAIVEFPAILQGVAKRLAGVVTGFFRSFVWALRFSHRCENEIRGRHFIDAVALARIMKEIEDDERRAAR